MTVAERIVIEARSWIGTPYLHQASVKGAGTDCLGLVRGVWRAVLGGEPEMVPTYTEDWAEPSHREVLRQGAERWLVHKAIPDVAEGDVLLFRMREGSIAKHLGIQTEAGATPSFVHSYTRHGVIESPLSLPWQRRIVARFAFPQGAG
ncbi:MAG: peptidase [Rhodobacter sp.]|nr:peptidase [Rhodobacter sp.]